MKQSRNVFEFIGNVGKDSEQMTTANGNVLTKFSIAVSDNYKGKDGNWVDVTDWFNVQYWNDIELKRGEKVYVSGKVKVSKKDETFYTNFVADQIFKLQGKTENEVKTYNGAVNEPENRLSDDVPF